LLNIPNAWRESFEKIAAVSPDVVLLDVHLPDANGIEICRELKSNPENASLLVIQMSASALTAPHATAALNSGADMYLMEPIDPDVLIATVRALLRVRKAEHRAGGSACQSTTPSATCQ
jgi:DNA-binding response OmpR family regulator